jgi:hypothetical protein
LLRVGVGVARNGNRAAARALFLALTREYPAESRAWLGLSGVAATPAEQRDALERALALDPANQRAHQALARLRAADPPAERVTQVLPETMLGGAARPRPAAEPAAAPPSIDDQEPAPAGSPLVPLSLADNHAPPTLTPAAPADAEEPGRFPLLNAIMAVVILALLATVGLLIGRAWLSPAGGLGSGPTTVLQPQPSADPASVPTAATAGPAPTIVTSVLAGPTANLPNAPAQGPTIASELPLGTVLDADGWSATLLRPDYAVFLDGAIGDLRPVGRFVLTLIAVSNNDPAPRSLPPTLFTLSDTQGRRYSPIAGASSAYLALYGRGQRGDLALEDQLEPASGMRTIPLIYDVPPDATGLVLRFGPADAGWPIGGAPGTPAGP